MTISPETPQVFQSKQREGFIRGRRSSVASTAERFESETVDDSTNLALSERTFTIRFQAYDEIQVGYHFNRSTAASGFHSCLASFPHHTDCFASGQLHQQRNKAIMVSFKGL
mmetsp:Transcript_32150/g.78120  ORF Transcript_32150/g.78120 Transcript_32150/m.78120 type:complete len:112 (+) Transcript_32150:286-621(+)